MQTRCLCARLIVICFWSHVICTRVGRRRRVGRTFLTNHVDGIAAIDLFVPTITFRLLYCLVILRHGRRLWVSFGVTTNPTAEWISRQIIGAFPWDSSPRYLIRDRDTAYGPIFRQRLRAMGIRDKPTAPRSPWQNPYVESASPNTSHHSLSLAAFITTIAEFDFRTHRVLIFGEAHLRQILSCCGRLRPGARTVSGHVHEGRQTTSGLGRYAPPWGHFEDRYEIRPAPPLLKNHELVWT